MQNHPQLFEMFKLIWEKMFFEWTKPQIEMMMNFPRHFNFKYFTFTENDIWISKVSGVLLVRYKNLRRFHISGNKKLLSAINVKGPNAMRQNI